MCVCVYPQRLSELYYDIHRSYLKVTEVVNSEKRLFGRYYRVAFYGQVRHYTVYRTCRDTLLRYIQTMTVSPQLTDTFETALVLEPLSFVQFPIC